MDVNDARKLLHQNVKIKHLFPDTGHLIIVLGNKGALIRTKFGEEGEFVSLRDAESVQVINARSEEVEEFDNTEDWADHFQLRRVETKHGRLLGYFYMDTDIDENMFLQPWEVEELRRKVDQAAQRDKDTAEELEAVLQDLAGKEVDLRETKIALEATARALVESENIQDTVKRALERSDEVAVKAVDQLTAAEERLKTEVLSTCSVARRAYAAEQKLAEVRENLKKLQLDYKKVKDTAEERVQREREKKDGFRSLYNKAREKVLDLQSQLDKQLDKQLDQHYPPEQEKEEEARPFLPPIDELFKESTPIKVQSPGPKVPKLGAGINKPEIVKDERGKTVASIIPTSDVEIQKRTKELAKYEVSTDYSGFVDCLLCKGTGLTQIGGLVCSRCNGKGMVDRVVRQTSKGTLVHPIHERPTKKMKRLDEPCPQCGAKDIIETDGNKGCVNCKWTDYLAGTVYQDTLKATELQEKTDGTANADGGVTMEGDQMMRQQTAQEFARSGKWTLNGPPYVDPFSNHLP